MGLVENWRRERERARRWREDVRRYGSPRIRLAALAMEAASLGMLLAAFATLAGAVEVDGRAVPIGIEFDPWVGVATAAAFVLAMWCASSWYRTEIALMHLRLDLETSRADAGCETSGEGD